MLFMWNKFAYDNPCGDHTETYGTESALDLKHYLITFLELT